MNRLFLILFSSSIFFLFSCNKDEHWVRINNESAKNYYVKIEDVSYDTVTSNTVSDYKFIGEEGVYTMYINSHEGTVTVAGTGYHEWTLTIDSTNHLSILEDSDDIN